MTQRASSQRGSTLSELLVVIAIVAMSVALAVPTLRTDETAGNEVRRILSDAVKARAEARSSWESVWLKTNLSTQQWRLETEQGSPIMGPLCDASGWRSLDPSLQFDAVAGAESDFKFLANGRFEGDSAIRVTGGDMDWIIENDPLSGGLRSSVVASP